MLGDLMCNHDLLNVVMGGCEKQHECFKLEMDVIEEELVSFEKSHQLSVARTMRSSELTLSRLGPHAQELFYEAKA